MNIGEPTQQNFSMNCLKCGKELDGFMAIDSDKARPRAGDVSLCIYCQHIMMFSGPVEGLPANGVREPTAKELELIANDRDIQHAIKTARQVKESWKFILYSER